MLLFFNANLSVFFLLVLDDSVTEKLASSCVC